MASHPAEGEREQLHPLRLYLNQAAQTPLFTPEDEKALAAQIHQGNAAQAVLLSTANKHLVQRLQQRPVRQAIRDLRALISPSLLRRAVELIALPVPRGLGEEMTDKTLLQAAFAIAGKKIPLRYVQTLDGERREAQEALLGLTRFTEVVLLGLAKRFVPRSQRAMWEKQERIARQGEEARDHLGRANLLLVVSIAKRGKFRWGALSLLDRIQEGNLGLLRAVDGFDPAFGTRFSSYASPCIVHAIDRALKHQTGVIRRPNHVHAMVTQFRRALQRIESQQGQGMRLEEGMEELRLKDQDRATIRLALRSQASCSLCFEEGDERWHEHRQVVEEEASANARQSVQRFRDRIGSLLQVLTEREAQVVTLRLGLDGSEPKIQRQIGELFGITRARAQQIEVKAIAKLQAAAGRTKGGMADAAPNGRPRGKLTHASYATLFQNLALGSDNGVQTASSAHAEE